MSYQDIARGGGAGGAVGRPGQQPHRAAENLLLKLANSIATLKRLVDVLGTAKDTVNHRHKLAEQNATTQELARQIKETLSQTHDASTGASAPLEVQQKHKKLLADFAALLQDYKATQKMAQEREAVSLPRPNPSGAGSRGSPGGSRGVPDVEQGTQMQDISERQALLQAQQTKQATAQEAEMALNEALIAERDAGIRDVVRQIGEVNEMFQDLAVLINDQGAQVRTIDESITATAERTKEGAAELVKAQRSQRSYRNNCLWCWLIAAVVVSLIIILTFA